MLARFIAKFILVSLSISTSLGWASGLEGKSAYREPGVSFEAYKVRAQILSQGQVPPPMTTPVDEALVYGKNKTNLPAATVWASANEMNTQFEKFRDYRFLERPTQPGFLRRSSWLYPDDGCFARASLAILNLNRWNVPVPKKVFVFGNLEVQTKNSPWGSVTWWYHVAPLVEVGGVKYVLDPSVEPKNPLRLEDWLARMSNDPDSLQVAVCGSGSYTPYDACQKDTDGVESMALTEQGYFLDSEWQRVLELGRNPENELGDLPPWLETNFLSAQ